MKKIICLFLTLFVFMSISLPLYTNAMSYFELFPEDWEEFQEKYIAEYGNFPFDDFGKLNEVAPISYLSLIKHTQEHCGDNGTITTVTVTFSNTKINKIANHLEIYLLDEELIDKHPVWLHYYIKGVPVTNCDKIDYTEVSEPIPPRNEIYTSYFITYCAPEDFIGGNGAVYKYQKEGIDIYLEGPAYNYCYFKIGNYFFRMQICHNEPNLAAIDTNYLFKSNKLYTEEEYLEFKRKYEGLLFEYELGYVWDDKSELVRVLKEIVPNTPTIPDDTSDPIESSNPIESSEPIENTSSGGDTVSEIVSDIESKPEGNESVVPDNSASESAKPSDNSIASQAEPEDSGNTVWIVVICVASVALIIAAAILITKKKK